MKPTRLNSDFILIKIGIIASPVLILILSPNKYQNYFTLFIALLIAVLIIVLIDKFPSTIIEFDDSNLYIKDKKNTTTIPIKNILEFRLSSKRINNTNYWFIIYKNIENQKEKIEFCPESSFSLYKLQDLTKLQNSNLIIKSSISTFDLF